MKAKYNPLEMFLVSQESSKVQSTISAGGYAVFLSFIWDVFMVHQ